MKSLVSECAMIIPHRSVKRILTLYSHFKAQKEIIMKAVEQFTIKSEDGAAFQVTAWAKEISTTHMGNTSPTSMPSSLARLETAEGYTVSPTDDGKFLVVELNLLCEKTLPSG